jgi:hypothetical protein
VHACSMSIDRNLGFLPETPSQEVEVLGRGFPRFWGLPEAHCGSTPVSEARHTGFWVPSSGSGVCRRRRPALVIHTDLSMAGLSPSLDQL